MKKLFLLISVIILTGLSIAAYAGEKEELQVQSTLLQERIGRLQAEYAIAIMQSKEVEARLKAIALEEEKKTSENTNKNKGGN